MRTRLPLLECITLPTNSFFLICSNQIVPPELRAIGQFALAGVHRARSFESFLRSSSLSIGLVETRDLREIDYWVRPPSEVSIARSAAHAANQTIEFTHERVQPVMEFLNAVIQFLNGNWWPNARQSPEDRIDAGLYLRLSCQRAFGVQDSSILPEKVFLRRVQSLVRDTHIIDCLMLLYRVQRIAKINNHLLYLQPSLLNMGFALENSLNFAAEGNERMQLEIACGRFSGQRRIPTFEVFPPFFFFFSIRAIFE